MSPRRRLVTSLIVLLVLSAAGAGVYFRINGSRAAASAAAAERGPPPDVSASESFSTDLALAVEGAAVVRDTLVISVTASGEAASTRQTVVRAQVGGQVRAVRAAENQPVGEGAVLIEIDPIEYRLALEEAQARLRQAQAQYREITVHDDRITDSALRAERDSVARVRSGLEGARLAVTRAELNLARTRVLAPFAGRISNLKVVAGQHVAAGEELLTVQAMDPIRIDVQVLEGEIGFLSPGRTARVTLAAFRGEVFSGVIEGINPVVDRDRRTARVSITVRNPDGRILPGMFATASLSARRFPDRILVPRAAILERSQRTMLFVYEPTSDDAGLAKWRYVNPGLMNDTHVEIVKEGPEDGMVEPGEIVLVGGHYTLTHDARVRLVESAAAAGGRPR